MTHLGALKRELSPGWVARERAAGRELGEGPCGLCGALVVFSIAERLEGSTLVCRRCCNDILTARVRQQDPVGLELPAGRGAGLLVAHDTGCPAPRGGPCGGGCKPDVTLVLGKGEGSR